MEPDPARVIWTFASYFLANSSATAWQAKGEERKVTSPVSLVVSAFAPVEDVRRCLTPELSRDEETRLVLFDLGAGRDRLGGEFRGLPGLRLRDRRIRGRYRTGRDSTRPFDRALVSLSHERDHATATVILL